MDKTKLAAARRLITEAIGPEVIEPPAPVKELTREEAGRRIRSARLQAGYRTGREAAKVVGIREQIMSDIERGRSMPLWSTVHHIAGKLGLDPRILWPEMFGPAQAQTSDGTEAATGGIEPPAPARRRGRPRKK